MKVKTQQKLSELLTKITPPISLNSAIGVKTPGVELGNSKVSKLSLQKLALRKKNTWRWQNKLFQSDRIGLDDPELIGKKSL